MTSNEITSKNFLRNDYELISEISKIPILINYNSSLTSNVNFLSGVEYDLSNTSLSSSISLENSYTYLSNTSSKVSYTGVYNHALSYLCLDEFEVKNKISNNSITSSFVREIQLPIQKFGDTIQPETFGISFTDNSQKKFNRYLKLYNNFEYDNGQNSAFVYFNDENWLNSPEVDSLKNKFCFSIDFRLNSDFTKTSASSICQYLLYRARINPREDFGESVWNWTYGVSAIPGYHSYDSLYANKFSPSEVFDINDSAYMIRLTYYSATSNHTLSGQFVFETAIGDFLSTFPAIDSSAISNSQSASLTSLTSNKNLLDSKWHNIIWSRKSIDSGGSNDTQGLFYLDGIRQINKNIGSNGLAPTTIAKYVIGNNSVSATTPIFLCAKVSPIDHQVTNSMFYIIEGKNESIKYISQRKILEPEYNTILSSTTAIERGVDINSRGYSGYINITGSNTNIFSFFGACDISKYISKYGDYFTSEILPEKQQQTNRDGLLIDNSKIISEYAIRGFNGDIASFYIWNDSLEDLTNTHIGSLQKPYEGINLSASFSSSLVYQQYLNKDPIIKANLIGDFRFFNEKDNSTTIKNQINSFQTFYNDCGNLYSFFGSGLFINNNNYRKQLGDKNIPNAKIVIENDIYDVNEKVFNSDLNHGKIVYKNSLNNVQDCGIIFYDFGLIIFNSNIFIDNFSKNLLTSITSNSNFKFSASANTPNITIENINYYVLTENYNNYLNVYLDSSEFNKSENTSVDKLNNIKTYPTTIGFYNESDELLATSKINYITEKNKFFELFYKVKLHF